MQATTWAAAGVGAAALEDYGTAAVHNKILVWHMLNEAVVVVVGGGCTGRLMVVVLKRGGWRMAEKEGQNSWEHCTWRVLRDAEEEEGGAAAAEGCCGSSLHRGHCS